MPRKIHLQFEAAKNKLRGLVVRKMGENPQYSWLSLATRKSFAEGINSNFEESDVRQLIDKLNQNPVYQGDALSSILRKLSCPLESNDTEALHAYKVYLRTELGSAIAAEVRAEKARILHQIGPQAGGIKLSKFNRGDASSFQSLTEVIEAESNPPIESPRKPGAPGKVRTKTSAFSGIS